ncbi:MAG TPA: AsnC family transcriptional regulator [Nitrososphaeraceae archaeon]|jgi:Lrp/AsnC family leucine-responsive transcriptional regulator|nr:AsnC family transcriptional regulator [Nitrososphaeraceae archaeon]
MPLQLDDYDVSILKSLLKDGRKSFREISRETGITTPTVKARFNRLVNVGFIKSVSPILDFDIVERNVVKPELQKDNNGNSRVIENEDKTKKKKQYNSQQQEQLQDTKFRIKKGIKIKLDCEFCKGPITGNPHVFRFANYERFFCCTACMSGYKQKYAGRIESIKRKFEGKE